MEKQTQETNWKKLDRRIEDILNLERPVQKTQRISDVAEEYGLDISDIKEELKRAEKIQKEKLKAENEKAKEEEKIFKKQLKEDIDKRKAEVKAEEKREKEKEKEKKEAKINSVKQEVKSKMDSDFQYNISTLLATNQENKATELCSKKAQEKHKFYSTKNDVKSELWVYDGEGITVANGKTLVEFLCRKWMGEAYEPRWVKNVVAKIKADNQIDEDVFFKQQSKYIDEIPVANGILNIFSKEVKPFTKEKIFFNKLPFNYNPESKCPNIEKFFKDVLNSEDDALLIYELIGFSLLKEYRYEKAFMFVGDGRNGKGKTINLIKRFLGAENYSSVPLDQFNTGSTGICEMFGKLVNLAGDISPTALKETGLLKQLCGRDHINAKRKYLKDLSFENYAKLIFAANELPRVYDFSRGFWSRWILLDFPYTFMSEREYEKNKSDPLVKLADVSIIDKITTTEELSGLLNKALEGLERLVKNKGFSYTKGTAEVKTMWVRKSDSFTAFCLDHLEESEQEFVSKKLLRKAFLQFCRKHKLKGTSDTSIKVTLESMFGVSEERPAILTGDWAWMGVKFKEKTLDGN